MDFLGHVPGRSPRNARERTVGRRGEPRIICPTTGDRRSSSLTLRRGPQPRSPNADDASMPGAAKRSTTRTTTSQGRCRGAHATRSSTRASSRRSTRRARTNQTQTSRSTPAGCFARSAPRLPPRRSSSRRCLRSRSGRALQVAAIPYDSNAPPPQPAPMTGSAVGDMPKPPQP